MLSHLLAMAAQPAGGQQGGVAGMLGMLIPFVLIFVIFWLLLIRPQMKKQKEHQKLLAALKKGDRVVTSSGMFGTIASFNEEKNIVVLKVAEDLKLEFLRSSIAGKVE
jgi:preprotein translocase subunit YajC